MYITILLILITILIVRVIDLYFFLRRVSAACYKYDWKHVDHNVELVVEMLKDEDYTKTSEWSAYNFLFYRGPSPLEMFLSGRALRIEEQYSKEAVKKLKQYDTN